MPVTVLLVSPDQPRWRELRRTLRRWRDIHIVGHLDTHGAAVEQAAHLTPDVVS